VARPGIPRLPLDRTVRRLTDSDVFSNFDGEAYLGLMQEKIRVATQQVMHAVRVQMRRGCGHWSANWGC